MEGEVETVSDTATNCNMTTSDMSDYNQAKLDSLEKKAVHLRLILEKDFKAADIKWSLFVAAAFSFRYESCLRPFPPSFMKGGIKDMDELLSVIADVPPLDLVLQQLDDLDNLANISDILDLLFYVLVRLKEPSLKTISPETHESILASTHSCLPATKPHYIFQVVSSLKSTSEMKWKELAKNHTVFYAYHGNRLENFYTILNFGLQQHLNKNTGLGNGVYLSSELNVILPYSYGGFGWGASVVGSHLSCVAMCEVIDAPQGINYQRAVSNEGDAVSDKDKLIVEGDGSLSPHYLVTNCELIRVRYLLVYAKQPASIRFPTPSNNRSVRRGAPPPPGRRRREHRVEVRASTLHGAVRAADLARSHASSFRALGSIRQWFARHKLFSILLGYGLMLATIGFANNQPINYYYKILLKKLDIAYSASKM